MDINMQLLHRYVKVTFRFVDTHKLNLLFHKYGFERTSVDVENTLRLMLRDSRFAYDYGVLVREAVQGREFKEALNLGQLDFVTGEAVGGGTAAVTSAANSGGALGWVNAITNAVTGIGGAVGSVWGKVKGTDHLVAEAEHARSMAELLQARAKSNIGLILGVAGGVVLLVLLVVLMRKK